jgi:hypothetical protein
MESRLIRNSPNTHSLHQESFIKVCIAASKSMVPLSGLHHLDQNQQRPTTSTQSSGSSWPPSSSVLFLFCFVSTWFPRRQFFSIHRPGVRSFCVFKIHPDSFRTLISPPRSSSHHITSLSHPHLHISIYTKLSITITGSSKSW